MAIPSTSTEPVELDLLQHIAVSVPCALCHQHYSVSLRHVLMSQEMVHEGCPVCSERECLPITYAGLADEQAVLDFERSWSRLRRQVQSAGFDLTITRPLLSH